jgi:hypothetical protein
MTPRVQGLFLLLASAVAVSPASAAQRSDSVPPPGVRSNPAWLTVTTGPTNASQQLPPQLFAITPKSHADELTPFGLDPSRRLGQGSAERAAKVSDTESPVSLMSASTGVRHQLGRLGQCPAAHSERSDLVVSQHKVQFGALEPPLS